MKPDSFHRPNLFNNLLKKHIPVILIAVAFCVIPMISAFGQQADDGDEQVFELSPFVVASDSDIGYLATSTLSGTRFNANLFETPASVSVITKELLNDLNAEGLEEYLQFAPSTDRDFAGDPSGLTASWTGSVVKTRGFSGVPVTRDYFGFLGISPDRFNVERLDVQKGPNAVLYGIGGPGGVINSTSKRAQMGSEKAEIALTIGSFDKFRIEGDYNIPVIDKKLAIRVNGLFEDSDNWQNPTKTEQEGIALAGTWRPLENTEIRAGIEHMKRFWILANPYPVGDWGASEWLAAGAPLAKDPLQPQSNPYPDLLQSANNWNIFFIPQLDQRAFRIGTVGADMRPDLDGNQPAGWWRTLPGPGAYPSARNTDLAMLELLGEDTNYMGPGFNRDDEYTVSQLFLTQKVLGFSVELAYAQMQRESVSHNPISWNSGVIGDPNPVFPGAYYANGSWNAAEGLFLGDPIATPRLNPFAGGLYLEGNPGGRDFENDDEYYRLTINREFDLTGISKWLGRHTIAAVWHLDDTRSLTAPFNMYNTSTIIKNQPLHSGVNQVMFRSYLDLSPGGTKWLLDPNAYEFPIEENLTPEYLHRGAWNWRKTQVEGKMAVIQSNFLKDRLIITAGYRNDRQTVDQAGEGEEFYPGSPILRLKPNDVFLSDGESPFYSFFDGETTTLGGFLKVTEWLGLTYNTSDAISPQGGLNIFGETFGNRVGKGEDFGIRLRLLENKLYINATIYETTDGNKTLTGSTNILWIPWNQAWNQVFATSLENGIPLPARLEEKGITEITERTDRWDLEGEGIELEIVGNITKNWSVSFNYSKNETTSSDGAGYAPDHVSFMEDYRSLYDGNSTPLNVEPVAELRQFIINRDNTPDRDFTAEPATFNDVYDFAWTVVDDARSGAGQTPLGHNEESFNFFTTYRFGGDMPLLLKNSRIGIGGNFRSENVIGFDASNNYTEIWGDSFFIGRLMLSKRVPLKDGNYVDFQLNFNNIFGEEDLLPYGTRSPDTVERYMFQRTRQSWTLKVTYGF